jgi:hypothetical protein
MNSSPLGVIFGRMIRFSPALAQFFGIEQHDG